MAGASGGHAALSGLLRSRRRDGRLAGGHDRPRAIAVGRARTARPHAKQPLRRVARRGTRARAVSDADRPARNPQRESLLRVLRRLRKPADVRRIAGQSVRVGWRYAADPAALGHRAPDSRLGAPVWRPRWRWIPRVSYTHLTLPTSDLV